MHRRLWTPIITNTIVHGKVRQFSHTVIISRIIFTVNSINEDNLTDDITFTITLQCPQRFNIVCETMFLDLFNAKEVNLAIASACFV